MDTLTQVTMLKLLETARLVEFTIDEPTMQPYGNEGEIALEVTIRLCGSEDSDPEEIIEWSAFGLIYTLAALSFNDARPRGNSGEYYDPSDNFSLADLIECLSYREGHLFFTSDYLRGRCVKTDIVVKREGMLTLSTRQRGKSAIRWLSMLQGKKLIDIV